MKKGFIGDGAFFSVFFFIFSIVVIVGWITLSSVNDVFNNSTTIPNESKILLNKYSQRYPVVYDWVIGLVLFAIIIGMIITGFFLKSTPALATVGIIVMIIIVGFSMFLSNSYRSFVSSDKVSSFAEKFTIMNIIMDNLPKIILFLLVIFIIILFSTNLNTSGGVI